MEFAIIKDNTVIRRIISSKKFADAFAAGIDATAISDDLAQVGLKKESGKWMDKKPKKSKDSVIDLSLSEEAKSKLVDFYLDNNIISASEADKMKGE